nr:homocysteine biosynthesis protein [bacterium]
MALTRTFDEVNEKIASGKAAVFTAEELIALVAEQGEDAALKKVDVVTTATFGAMCSSGAFLNFGHSQTPIRMGHITLNDVEAYGGLAAVDTYIGATQPSDTRGMEYGGAHVIEDLVAGKTIRLKASSYGTDCYPTREVEADISLDTLNQAYLYNPRNLYQNYSAATNTTERTLHTYMGTLLPNMANITYSTSGELSPLLKDPKLRTIGVGTHIFLGGGDGYVAWEGTQATFGHEDVGEDGTRDFGCTLAVIGDLRGMSPRYLRGATYEKYGCTLYVGIGIPIPVLDAELLHDLARPNSQLYTRVFDYSVPSRSRPDFGLVSYAQLRSGRVEVAGKSIPTAPLSSLSRAREIASLLKEKVSSGAFMLQQPMLPIPHHTTKGLNTLKEV